jgi:hypothetical protein
VTGLLDLEHSDFLFVLEAFDILFGRIVDDIDFTALQRG